MITVEDRERIRRGYFMEQKSVRALARELGHSRPTIRKALAEAEPGDYSLKAPRVAPVLGLYRTQIDALLVESEGWPRKQRYTAHRIFERLRASGYGGGESTVRAYVARQRAASRRPAVYLPLEYDPGIDAQVDWGEAEVEMAGVRRAVQLFVMRLCYSRRLFVRAYPTQKQESFFEGHVHAFRHSGGVPQRLTYDNLGTAVLRVLEGRNREEQRAFVVFRSHYLFESRFCTPGEGHEKGGVESGVGYARRNFLVPLPVVTDFEALNAHLLAECLKDDGRRVDRQPLPIAEAWALERPHLRTLPGRDFTCCVTVPVTLNPYGQVSFETNRYSVPADQAVRQLVLKAYPFRVDILHGERVLASHPRSYEREREVCDPLHYLSLLEQRPGAFEHARPLRQWRGTWPAVYERLLAHLRSAQADGGAIPVFVRILKLHQEYPAELVEQAITQALAYGCAHVDGVRLCLRQLQQPDQPLPVLDLSGKPELAAIGQAPVDLARYEHLLAGG